jgi:hypothetical protein
LEALIVMMALSSMRHVTLGRASWSRWSIVWSDFTMLIGIVLRACANLPMRIGLPLFTGVMFRSELVLVPVLVLDGVFLKNLHLCVSDYRTWFFVTNFGKENFSKNPFSSKKYFSKKIFFRKKNFENFVIFEFC